MNERGHLLRPLRRRLVRRKYASGESLGRAWEFGSISPSVTFTNIITSRCGTATRISTMSIISTHMTSSGMGRSHIAMRMRMRRCATAMRTFPTFIIGTGISTSPSDAGSVCTGPKYITARRKQLHCDRAQ